MPTVNEGTVLAPKLWGVLPLMLALAGGAAVAAEVKDGQHPRPTLLARMLKNELAGVQEIVFAVRGPGKDGHWYANFGYWSSGADHKMYATGGSRLCALNLRTGQVRDILADPGGGIRDPQVHYSGKKILFSYRKAGSEHYHLHEVDVDGSNLRQITRGNYDELEPIYLPDGDLLFCSSQCNRWVQCWHTQVAILHRCRPDGSDIRPLSANVEQDNTPWMMPDGQVLYTRWEYVDRSRVQFHHLWTMNPDGTGQMVYYGNQNPGIVMIDAKPVPNSSKVVVSFSPGHGRSEHGGRITFVDPKAGPDERSSARPLDMGDGLPRSLLDDCRDPYALSEGCVLFAAADGLYLTDGRGSTQRLCQLDGKDRGLMIQEPRPIIPTGVEPLISTRTQWGQSTGRVVLVDVNHGRNMGGVKQGEIRKLLVLETLPKPINHSGTMEPISLDGTFTLPRILGTVPVEADGSAYIELPALRSLFFVALDEHDLSVKRMQSFLMVMPGETTSCAGCHERRTDTVRSREMAAVAATRRPPSRIEPIADVPEVFDFPRDIQPILTRRCLPCHSCEKRAGGAVLTADHTAVYSQAYVTLMAGGLVSHGRDAQGNRPPRNIGSSASRLMKKIDGSHHDVKLSPHEQRMVRLWIESGAPYAGTYAALGTGMVNVKLDEALLGRRCGSCHAKGRLGGHKELLTNLSHPQKSLVLLAPLAREAGGYALCRPRKAPESASRPSSPFADASDADYQKLLADIRRAQTDLERIKRFDMPDFKPSVHYIREMKRYGILPASLDLSRDPIDVYSTERAYWRSLWYKPATPEMDWSIDLRAEHVR